MDVMSVATMATNMKAAELQQQVGTSVLKKGMDAVNQQMSQLIEGFSDVSAPSFHELDVRV